VKVAKRIYDDVVRRLSQGKLYLLGIRHKEFAVVREESDELLLEAIDGQGELTGEALSTRVALVVGEMAETRQGQELAYVCDEDTLRLVLTTDDFRRNPWLRDAEEIRRRMREYELWQIVLVTS